MKDIQWEAKQTKDALAQNHENAINGMFGVAFERADLAERLVAQWDSLQIDSETSHIGWHRMVKCITRQLELTKTDGRPYRLTREIVKQHCGAMAMVPNESAATIAFFNRCYLASAEPERIANAYATLDRLKNRSRAKASYNRDCGEGECW